VTFSGHVALGGNGNGSFTIDGGGGFGGSINQSSQAVQGAAGGDLFGLGGLTAGASGGPGGGGAGSSCTAGAIAGNGGFGAGGGMSCAPSNGVGGNGGFGGGGGAGFAPSIVADAPGTGGFGGGTGFLGNNTTSWPGGGAGFGGAIFQYAGTLTLNNDQFLNNSAVGGVAQVANGTGAAINNGQGKGGALFIYNGAIAINNGSTFGVGAGAANIAADAGAPGIGSSTTPYTTGVTCPGQDSVDVCGTLLQPPSVSLSGPAGAVYGSQFSVTPASNSGATPSVSVVGGPCQLSASNITMTAGTGACQLQATWPATPAYSSASPRSVCRPCPLALPRLSPPPARPMTALRQLPLPLAP
jgi:hypothetical protein